MNNFEITTPTTLVFGKNQLDRIKALLLNNVPDRKLIILYGGGSIEKSGFLDTLRNTLSDFEIHLFKGIEANPEYETLMRAVKLIREEKIPYMLAVGGGSVIDGAKFISGAVHYEGDSWDVLQRKPGCDFTNAVPFGCILTLPATGSESNSGAVISRSEIKEKRTMGGPLFFPQFALLDPTFVSTLPARQIANGIVDSYMHTLEQYLTVCGENPLQERYAEGLLSTLLEIGEKVVKNPADYDLAASLMWCANQALNGLLRCGVTTDWATHMIGHELTALHGIDHARTLAIVAPRLYELKFESKQAKLTQYGKRVWNLTGTDQEVAQKAIEKTESFFHTLGIKTRISDYTTDYENTPQIVYNRFVERNWMGLGEHKSLTPEDAQTILKSAF